MPTLIENPSAVLCTLITVVAFFFYLEQKTQWKLFTYLPPLLFIYSTPVLLSNTGVIPQQSDVYSWMSSTVLPMILVMLMLKIDIRTTFRQIGKGVFVVWMAMLGVIIGAPIAFYLVKSHLGPDGWKAFGTLSGSWIGGTGNMAAVAEMIKADGPEFGLAVLGDNVICLFWIPMLLALKSFAKPFAKFTGANQNSILNSIDVPTTSVEETQQSPTMGSYVVLLFLALLVTCVATALSERLPEFPPVLMKSTWKILLVTTFGLMLSFTKARQIPSSQEFSMALVYIFVANMGARTNVTGLAEQAPWFLLGSAIWILIHGVVCVIAAKIFKADIHMTVLASAVNIGGIASAPIIAAHHHKSLIPVSILMALMCYAFANYAGWITAMLCQWIQ